MTKTATVAISFKRADATLEPLTEAYNPGVDHIVTTNEHLYRILIGVYDNFGNVRYICYRKDKAHEFVVDTVNFDSEVETEDTRFIFTTNEVENLIDYLSEFDDRNLATIARLGQTPIDEISLLPII